jgi:hypothetical protein
MRALLIEECLPVSQRRYYVSKRVYEQQVTRDRLYLKRLEHVGHVVGVARGHWLIGQTIGSRDSTQGKQRRRTTTATSETELMGQIRSQEQQSQHGSMYSMIRLVTTVVISGSSLASSDKLSLYPSVFKTQQCEASAPLCATTQHMP